MKQYLMRKIYYEIRVLLFLKINVNVFCNIEEAEDRILLVACSVLVRGL